MARESNTSNYPANPLDSSAANSWALANLRNADESVWSRDREDYANYANYYQHLADQLFSKEQTELAWSRNSPAAQLQQLMALGMTRSQALQAITASGAEAAQSTAAPQYSAQQSLNGDLMSVAGTVSEVAMTAFNLYTGAAMFGINLATAEAASQAAKSNAVVAERVNQGQQIAGSVFQQFSKSRAFLTTAGDFDEEKDQESLPAMFSAIERAASKNDPSAKEWLDTIKPYYDSNVFAQKFAQDTYNGLMSTNKPKEYASDRRFYVEQKVLQNHILKLDGDKLCAEISQINASEKKIYKEIATQDVLNRLTAAQTSGQELANASASLDYKLKTATFDDVKRSTLMRLQIDLAELGTLTSPDALQMHMDRVLDDEAKATALAAAARVWAEADLNAVNENPQLVEFCSIYDSPNVVNALASIAHIKNVETATDPIGKWTGAPSKSWAAQTILEILGYDFGNWSTAWQRQNNYP